MVPASSPAMPERAANRRRPIAKDRRVLLRIRIPPAAWRDFRPGDYRITPRRIGFETVRCAMRGCHVRARLPPARATVPAAIADGCGMNVRALNMDPRINQVLMGTMLRRGAGRGNRPRCLPARRTCRLSRRSNESAPDQPISAARTRRARRRRAPGRLCGDRSHSMPRARPTCRRRCGV